MSLFLNPDTWHDHMRRARKHQRITQQEMAKRTNIHQSRISQLENGQVEPKLSELVAISELVGSIVLQVPDYILPSVLDLSRDFERRTKTGRARTIPELILGDSAHM